LTTFDRQTGSADINCRVEDLCGRTVYSIVEDIDLNVKIDSGFRRIVSLFRSGHVFPSTSSLLTMAVFVFLLRVIVGWEKMNSAR
jgi:hypothetical protein